MLAKNVNDDAGYLTPSGALRFFASKLAPKVGFSYAAHGDVRITCTKFIGLNPGSWSTSTSVLTLPNVVCGRWRKPSANAQIMHS